MFTRRAVLGLLGGVVTLAGAVAAVSLDQPFRPPGRARRTPTPTTTPTRTPAPSVTTTATATATLTVAPTAVGTATVVTGSSWYDVAQYDVHTYTG